MLHHRGWLEGLLPGGREAGNGGLLRLVEGRKQNGPWQVPAAALAKRHGFAPLFSRK